MYSEAATVLQAGLRKGGIDRPDQANLMLGMALFEQLKFDAAKTAFTNARKDRRSREAADNWRKYVESEQRRKAQIEASFRARRG